MAADGKRGAVAAGKGGPVIAVLRVVAVGEIGAEVAIQTINTTVDAAVEGISINTAKAHTHFFMVDVIVIPCPCQIP